MTKKVRAQRTAHKPSQANGISSYAIPIIVGVVMVALVVGAIILNEKRSSSAAAVQPEDISVPVVTVAPQPTTAIPYPDVPRITLKETQSLMEKGQAVLIDVRGSEAYDQEHAAGAILFTEADIATRLNELPRDKQLILYCT